MTELPYDKGGILPSGPKPLQIIVPQARRCDKCGRFCQRLHAEPGNPSENGIERALCGACAPVSLGDDWENVGWLTDDGVSFR